MQQSGTGFFIIMTIPYKDQLRKPDWQKKRLEIMQRDNFTCQICLDTEETLQVHHKSYDKGKMAWEYGNDRLTTLCETYHSHLTDHIKDYGDDKEFSVLKIKRDGLPPIAIIYSNGNIIFSQSIQAITENVTHKLVQFLINNWLKNG